MFGKLQNIGHGEQQARRTRGQRGPADSCFLHAGASCARRALDEFFLPPTIDAGAIFSAVSALGATFVSCPWSSLLLAAVYWYSPRGHVGYILGKAFRVRDTRHLQPPTLRNQFLLEAVNAVHPQFLGALERIRRGQRPPHRKLPAIAWHCPEKYAAAVSAAYPTGDCDRSNGRGPIPRPRLRRPPQSSAACVCDSALKLLRPLPSGSPSRSLIPSSFSLPPSDGSWTGFTSSPLTMLRKLFQPASTTWVTWITKNPQNPRVSQKCSHRRHLVAAE